MNYILNSLATLTLYILYFRLPKISLFAPFVSDSTLACYPSGVKEQSGTARVSHLQEEPGYTAR